MIQTLNQDLADQTAEIREEKSKNLRLNNEVNNTKAEKARLQELMDQGRKKDFKMHLLVITNWHIKNFRFMKQQDIELLEYMKQVGAKVLEHEAPGAK